MISAVILSAGESKRFGDVKQLYKIDGVPILQRVIDLTCLFFPEIILVLGYRADEVIENIKTPQKVKIVINPYYKEGMGGSLAFSIPFISAFSSHVAIFLSDMPFIKRNTVGHLINNISNKKEIVAPIYRGERGFPVFFSRDFFEDLEKLKGDKGARDLIKKEKKFLRLIDVSDPGVIWDIDTKDDL